MNVGMNIKILIADKGLKQKYVANKIGLSERQLSALIHGQKLVNSEIILRLCNVLDVDPNTLLGYTKSG